MQMREIQAPIAQPDEATPLLLAADARPSRGDTWRCLLPLLCIFLLERCSYYGYMSSLANSQRGVNDTYLACDVPINEGQFLLIEWRNSLLLQCIAFLLPLLGGFVADYCCGTVWALRIGCAMYFLGAWMLTSWRANCAPALMLACELVLVSAAGLLRPSLLVLTFESGWPLMDPRQLCQLYYLWEAAGQVLGYLLALASDVLRVPLAGACVPTTLLMMLLTLGVRERPGWNPRLFGAYMLRWIEPPRLKRIILLSVPLILVSCSVTLGYYTLSVWELSYAAREEHSAEVRWSRNILMLCYSIALVAAVVALMLMTSRISFIKKPEARITVGILAASLGQLADFGMDWACISFGDLLAAYACLNVAYAVAEAFAITTANEIAIRIAPREIRTFMIGLFMGFWGSGYAFSSAVAIISYILTEGHEPDYFRRITVWVHLSLGVLLLGTILYLKIWVVNAKTWLLENKQQESPETVQED